MNRCGIKFSGILLVITLSGCKLRPDNGAISSAAAHFAGVFITKNITDAPELRIEKNPDVRADSGDMYRINGSVEGFSSFNAPVTLEHFSETLQYLGGNPNEITSWECMEIYIGKRKVK